MADGIRIRTLLSPGVPRGLRAEMFKHQQDLDAVAQDLQAARDMVEAGDLQGATADRLFDAMTDNTDNAKRLMDAVKALVEALGALADALTSTGLWFDNLADAAVAEHLERSPRTRSRPPPTPRTPAYDAQVEAYSQFCEESYEIYEKERKAYEDFESACQGITGPLAWVAGQVLPNGSWGDIPKWHGLIDNTTSVIMWGAVHKARGRFAPRWPAGATNAMGQSLKGKFRNVQQMGWFRRHWEMTKHENWVSGYKQGNKPAATIGRAARRFGNLMGRIGIVATLADGVLSAKDQWERDAINPQIGTGERVARATTTGATTAGGGWLGAWGGAKAGAFIGTFGGPIGIAAGTVIGGIVGSSLGSVASGLAKGVLNWLFHG